MGGEEGGGGVGEETQRLKGTDHQRLLNIKLFTQILSFEFCSEESELKILHLVNLQEHHLNEKSSKWFYGFGLQNRLKFAVTMNDFREVSTIRDFQGQ